MKKITLACLATFLITQGTTGQSLSLKEVITRLDCDSAKCLVAYFTDQGYFQANKEVGKIYLEHSIVNEKKGSVADNRASEVILDMSKNKLVEISIRYPNITAYKRFFNELSALGFKESTLKKSTGNFRYWSSQYPNVEIIPAEIIKSGATVCDYCMVEIKIKK